MKAAIIFLFSLGAVIASPEDEYLRLQFAKFQVDFGKEYLTRGEQEHRFNIFKANLKEIKAHNNAGHSYKKGINQFSDLTKAEFKSQALGYIPLASPKSTEPAVKRSPRDLPESVDWREKGAITAVKNQGQCGSCWAFATTEMIESYAAISTGTLPTLSTQQVTSCTPNTMHCGGVGGCRGSIPQLAYSYIQLFGHSTEEDYPYVSGSTTNTEDCMYDVSNTSPQIGIRGYNTYYNDPWATMEHLANDGPVAVSVDAGPWHSYSSGVFDGCSYDQNIGLNHVVQMVGYGTDPTEGDYWLVRNSWGTSWGEDGYIRLKREQQLECGINSTPLDGTACEGDHWGGEQNVCGMCGVLFDVSYPEGAHAIQP